MSVKGQWKISIITVISIAIIGISFGSIYAVQQYDIPSWFKGVAGFWAEDKISDTEFGEGLSFLISNDIVIVPEMESLKQEVVQLKSKVNQLERENVQLKTQQKSSTSNLDIIAEKKTSVGMSQYCQALEDWNEEYKGVTWLTAETKKEFNKLCVTQSTSVAPSKSSSSTSEIRNLLPSKADIGEEWKIYGTGTLSPTSKNFYYETGRESLYSKDVSIFKKFVMRVFKFTDNDLAQDRLEYKRFDIRTKDGGVNNKYLLLNDKDCIVTKIPRGGVELIYGYCIEKNLLIYGYLEGYYPNMKSDFMNFIQITKNKI